MYTGNHVDLRICRVTGNKLTPPSKGGCYICWKDEEKAVLVKDDEYGVWVHQSCLDYFGVDNYREYEQQEFEP